VARRENAASRRLVKSLEITWFLEAARLRPLGAPRGSPAG